MPSSQPVADIEAIEDPIVKAYAKAWERVTRLQQAIVDNPKQWRRANKLKEAREAIIASMDELDIDISAWLSGRFPQVYAMGAAAGSAEAGGPASFVWSQVSQQAVQDMAQDLFDDLLAKTNNVRDTTKTMVRAVMKDEMLAKAIIGDTAQNASKVAAKLLETKGISAITYRDGSKHGLAEYSEMAVRTKTGTAYNVGTLTGAEAQGINYWEVFDGPFCGWAFHDDSIAMGRVVTKDEALSYPLAHPNCRRAFGARPDITNKHQAKDETKNGGSTTTGQRQAQIEQDAERLESQRIARNSQARVQRRQANQVNPSKRQDKLNQRRARNGDLDMSPPSPLAEAMMPADAYAGLKTVSELISDGWSPGDAAKEFKRLKANAASKASKQKAKLAKLDTVVKTKGPTVTPAKGPASNVHHLQGYNHTLTVDTFNYIPAENLALGSYQYPYTIKAGIATRRDGVTYILETKGKHVAGPAQLAELENAIKVQQGALLEAGVAKDVNKVVILAKGRNPADKYWAKQYHRPGFRSAATGGNGTVTMWDHPISTGTLRHEAGHNFDFGIAKSQHRGSDTQEWRDAMAADAKTSSQFAPKSAWDAHVHEPGSPGHPITFGESKGITGYGQVANTEDWAESFRLYLRDQADGKLGTIPKQAIGDTLKYRQAYDLRFVDAFPARAKIFDELTGNMPIKRTDFTEVFKPPATSKQKIVTGLTADSKIVGPHGARLMDDNGFHVGFIKEVHDPSTKLGYSYSTYDIRGELVSSGDTLYGQALERLQYHLNSSANTTTKVAIAKDHIITQLEKKLNDEWPGQDAARKGLPKNVQASIASKKSVAKKHALEAGQSQADATATAAAVEKDEIYKRWVASHADGKATKGLVQEETGAAKAVTGEVTLASRRADLLKSYNSGIKTEVELSGGTVGNKPKLLTFNDGTKAVIRKRGVNVQNKNIAFEEIADALGAETMASVRVKGGMLLSEYIEGESNVAILDVAHHLWDNKGVDTLKGGAAAREAAMLAKIQTDGGKRLGLADFLAGHGDRHSGNWIWRDGKPVAIDNDGVTFRANASVGDFGGKKGFHFADGTWLEKGVVPDITKQEVRVARQQLQHTEGVLTDLGHKDWFDFAMGKLDTLEARAPEIGNFIKVDFTKKTITSKRISNEDKIIADMAKRDAARKVADDLKATKLNAHELSTTRLQVDVDASESFLNKIKDPVGSKYISDAEVAKDTISSDLATRLNNEKDWNTYRDYKAATSPFKDPKLIVSGKGLTNEGTEKVLAYFAEDPARARAMRANSAFDSNIGKQMIKDLGLSEADREGYNELNFLWSLGEIKPGFSRITGHASGIPDYSALATAERQAILKEETSERIQQWAVSSGDTHSQSIMMQMAAKEEFGLDGNALVRAAGTSAGPVVDYPGVKDFYRRFARVQYESTQAAFKADGITHIYLHRGMSFNGHGPAWAQPGVQELKLQPMNSWSAREEIAQDFSSTPGDSVNAGIATIERVFSARVPVESIIGTARSGWGCLHEWEYVVMNTPGKVTVTRSTKELASHSAIDAFDANW